MRKLLVVLLVNSLCFLAIGCHHDGRLQAPAVDDFSVVPNLVTHDVTTLVSDSGTTRYRIKARTWAIYDKADPEHWEFPKGLYLEKFNEDLTVDASMEANYAYYNKRDRLWRLEGAVHALNQQHEQFDTELLFWDQNAERIYTDSLITISRPSSVIVGIGFESNQTMSRYTILQPTGYFPIEE